MVVCCCSTPNLLLVLIQNCTECIFDNDGIVFLAPGVANGVTVLFFAPFFILLLPAHNEHHSDPGVTFAIIDCCGYVDVMALKFV
jgi:hypothetical protein